MNEIELLSKIKEGIKKNQYFYQIKDEHDRQTIINNTFLLINKNINNGKLSNDYDNLKDYIFISTRNNCLKYLRRKQIERTRYISDNTYCEKYDTPIEEEEYTLVDYQIEKIKSLLELDIDKEIIRLRLEGYRFKEISEILNIDEVRIHNIMKTLLRYLRKKLKGEKVRRYPPSLLIKEKK